MPMDRTKLPTNVGRNALSFDGDSPEDLDWYINTIEEWADTYKATTDADKKWLLLHYCKPATVREWRGLKTLAAEYTYAEFKAELLMNYPESREAEEGSLAILDKLMKEYRKAKVEIDDSNAYMALSRKFKALADKLTGRASNRELIQQFLGCLDPELVNAVKNKLRNLDETQLTSYKTAKKEHEALVLKAGANPVTPVPLFVAPVRAREDKYFWTDVLAVAQEIVEEEAVSFYGIDVHSSGHKNTSGKKTTVLMHSSELEVPVEGKIKAYMDERTSALENSMAQGMDKSDLTNKQRFDNVESLIRELQAANKAQAPAQESPPRQWNGTRGPSNTRQPEHNNCFYCLGKDHYQGDCTVRHGHIDKGQAKVVDGRTLFYDGKNIPSEPRNKSRAQKVEDYYKNRHHSQNVVYTGSTYQDEDDDPNYDPRADEIRTLKFEKAQLKQELLSSTSSTSASSGQLSGIPPEALEQIVSFLNTRWDDNNQQFVATTRQGGGKDDSGKSGFQ